MSHYNACPRYLETFNSWLTSLPKIWVLQRLRYVSTYQNSNVDKKNYPGQPVVQLCNYTDVYYNEFVRSGIEFMFATASPREIKKFGLQAGDLIITKDSEDPRDIGIPTLVTEDLPGVICGYHLTVIRTNSLLKARFLHRLLQSHITKAHFFIESPGVTRFGLNQQAIGNVPVILPTESEMQVIVDYLDCETARIDALIEKKTRFIELLKEKRQALVTHAVTKGLDANAPMKDSGVQWIGEVPAHWNETRLRFIVKERGGKTPSKDNGRFWDGNIPWVSPKDMKVDVLESSIDKITELAVQQCGMTMLEARTVLIVVRGMILAHSFPVAETSVPVTINQDMKALTPREDVEATFLRLLLQSLKQVVVDILVAEAAHGTRVLRTDIWKQLPVFLPPQSEQKAIIQRIEGDARKIDMLVKASMRSIQLLKERRSALVTAAVTGQIDLREDAT